MKILDQLFAPRLIAVRNDGAARDFESLERRSALAKGSAPARVRYEGENRFEIDLL